MSAESRLKTVEELARGVRLLTLDVDGVLTDGGLYFNDSGLFMKRFDVHDGIGLRFFREAGFEVAVISGMDVPCVERRLEALGITLYCGGSDNKVTKLESIRRAVGVEWEEIAYMGDDWVDLAPMSRVGLPIAVANALPEVRKAARMITSLSGGHGAVREVTDFLLACKGLKDEIVENWRRLV